MFFLSKFRDYIMYEIPEEKKQLKLLLFFYVYNT